VRQAAFFCQDIDAVDPRFDVNNDVVDNQLVNEVESNPEEGVEKGAAVDGDDNKAVETQAVYFS